MSYLHEQIVAMWQIW